ncbi:general substrate transporter [Schizophyllum commune H4-8]|uniref:Major facilitator superfamily (MFS) profile domain-containing protein n=1 Tax=Schizophyllum commune (strain H4-8 / FGSC 9210) TaxID=578458 RepID=D8QHL9_SCHCM|nr:general substrate transporter [Schizophyllum commune H4-8]KAI5887242.1 general substrate transporter [Schizophyllum commune H4-8]
MGAGAAVAGVSSSGFAHLIDPNKKWWNNRRLFNLTILTVLLLITSSTNGYDGSVMNAFQSVDQWKEYFGHPQGSRLGLLNAIQNIGNLCAYPFAPYLSDGLGRRPAILIGAIIMCGGAALQTASTSIGMFIGSRFMIGFGLTFAANAAPLLITEISYPAYRAPLTSAYNALWYIGSIVAAWATYGTFKIANNWSWRIPSVIQAAPSVLQIMFIWFVPESPRFLMSKGKNEEALKVLAHYHADGNVDDPLVRYEYEEIKAALEFDQTVAANVGWKALATTPGNRKRMRIIIALAFFSQWSGNGLVSYYLNAVFNSIGITDATTQLLINGILQIWNQFWALGAGLLVNRIGRRTLFLWSTVGMFIFFTIQTICSARFAIDGTDAAAHAVVAFIFLFYAAYDIAYSPLIVSYTVEILPFHLRAKGLTVFNFMVSCSLIFNQYVNPIALKAIAWKYYIVYVCWIAFEIVFIYLYCIETKGKSLEETAALFDGEEAETHIAGVAHKHTEEVIGKQPLPDLEKATSHQSMHMIESVPKV